MNRRELFSLMLAAPLLRCATTENMTARLSARPARTGSTKLLVMLHGAGGRGANVRQRYTPFARQFGFEFVAPDSQGTTWDVIHSTWGPDVVGIDATLDRAFRQFDVDPHHLGIAGFSDGAS